MLKKLLVEIGLIVAICTTLTGVALYTGHGRAKATVKAPTSRYHGYKLNHAAIQRTKWFTVLISNEGFGGVGRGTGILIDPKHILTCAHMVEAGNDDIWIFPYPGFYVDKGHPVFVNRSLDLAILELDIPIVGGPKPVFQPHVAPGQPITIIGNTLGSMKWFVSYGIISGEYKDYLLTDGLIKGGNSGGPWINDNGEVLALTDWGLQDKGKDAGISGGVSAETILKFLHAWKNPTLFDLLLNG